VEIRALFVLFFSVGILVPLDWPNFVKAQDAPITHQLIAKIRQKKCAPVYVCRWVWNGRQWVRYCYWVCPGGEGND
jgi:hypothetical protein